MTKFSKRVRILSAILFSAVLSVGQPTPPGYPSPVQYNPQEKVVEGNQPLFEQYSLTIKSPSNLSPGVQWTINLGTTVLSKPATGVTDGQALGFITVVPATLTFTGPNHQLATLVTVSVPLGNYAGNYAYKILPDGWPTDRGTITDAGATVNAIALPPGTTDVSPPSITLNSPVAGTVYTYQPATGLPVSVPVGFSATVGSGGQPIDTMLATVSGPTGTLSVALTSSPLPSSSATATGSINLTAPGSYTVNVAATNRFGTSFANSTFTVVVVAPPPVITVASPAANSTFSYTLGGAGASVPVSFSATGVYGNITSLSATLDGLPIALSTSGVGGSNTATGSASLTVAATGSHTLVFSAANAFGSAVPVTVPFTVAGLFPAPTVTILTPANGATFTRDSGDPATIVNYSFQGATSFGTITSAVVTVDGVPVTNLPVITGLGTAGISATGSLSYTSGGPHTIAVKVTNSGGAMASAATSFTVNVINIPICADINWLPPISLNKTIHGGSHMPIKFTLECRGKFVEDKTILIAIYEVFQNGSHSNPVIYPYGTGSPNPKEYAITGHMYHLNFDTANGTHSYQIEVYSSASGTLQLIGTKELNTQ